MVIRMNGLLPLSQTDDAPMLGIGHPQSEAEKARALVETLSATGRRSTAELLHELRRAFPNSPLAVRVRALEVLRRR
jgi:hypothetical protein